MRTPLVAPDRGPVKAAWILLILAWALFIIIPWLGGFIGWPLNLVALILSIVILTKGNTRDGIVLLLCALIVSPLLYWLAPLVLLAMGVGAAHMAG